MNQNGLDHTIFSITNLSDVQMHLLAAIFIASVAISSPVNLVCAISALAAHSAQSPPLPIPIASSISSTLPVPSSSTIRLLSMTISVASRCRNCLPVLHSLAQVMQLFRVCLGYFDITCSSPSIRQNASAKDPANPQKTPSPIFLILRASILTLVLPSETCPSPMMTVSPSLLSASMVVWCHFSVVKPHLKKLLNISIIISMIIPINRSLSAKSKQNASEQLKQEREIINGHGVHDTIQLILVGLLIIASVTVVYTTNQEIHQHDRYLRTYFNLNLLGKDDLGLYEEGLNIDECQMEFATLDEMKEHFTKILNVSNSIEEDGLVAFTARDTSIIKFEMQTENNDFNITQFDTVEQAMAYFHNLQTNFFRDLLLSSYQLKLVLHLGENKFVKDYQLVADYQLYSGMMIKAKLDAKFQLKKQKERKLNGLRILQQVVASVLFMIYLYQTIILSRKSQKHRIFRREFKDIRSLTKTFRNWYIFLQLMCLIILFSQKFAPICAFLQILPIFEFPDRQEEKENELYNFNKNLRFSFPLIMTIFFQIFIFLNGFIFYSMLMYPGDYFDDYLKGFFSYVYQLFQVGTYQIFTELQSYGNFAYMLYAMLYFYVFEVGNSLIPALFVIMIEMKVTQKFLKRHITKLIQHCACPKCLEKNSHQLGANDLRIIITSPKLSPLLNRKKYGSQNQSKQQQSETLMMLYIEEELDQSSPQENAKKFHENYKFANYSKKILHISRRLQNQIFKSKDQQWLKQCQQRISRLSQRFS